MARLTCETCGEETPDLGDWSGTYVMVGHMLKQHPEAAEKFFADLGEALKPLADYLDAHPPTVREKSRVERAAERVRDAAFRDPAQPARAFVAWAAIEELNHALLESGDG